VAAVALALLPAGHAVAAARGHQWPVVGWSVAAMAGCLGVRYSLVRLDRRALRAGGGAAPIALGIGVLIMLAALPARLHAQAPDVGRVAVSGVSSVLLYLHLPVPVVFVLEEVTFRGLLDSHVHPQGAGHGWAPAVGVSAMWGLWHLPITAGGALPWWARAVELVAVRARSGFRCPLRGGAAATCSFPAPCTPSSTPSATPSDRCDRRRDGAYQLVPTIDDNSQPECLGSGWDSRRRASVTWDRNPPACLTYLEKSRSDASGSMGSDSWIPRPDARCRPLPPSGAPRSASPSRQTVGDEVRGWAIRQLSYQVRSSTGSGTRPPKVPPPWRRSHRPPPPRRRRCHLDSP
jgi:hypothetical protein